MGNIHKTSQGDEIDMEKLILQHEEVRAVGNMNVNARGDIVNSENKNISSRSKQVNRQYKKQTAGLVRDIPVLTSKKQAKAIADKYTATAVIEAEILKKLDEVDQETPKPVSTRTTAATTNDMDAVMEKVETQASSGLAGAIAKAKEVKQEPMKTQLEQAREGDGVKKI